MTHIDVAIIGGGIVGSSTAYYLRKNGFSGRIVVFEKDPTYTRACTPLSWGGIRQQFSNPENIHLSQFGLRLIRDLKQEFGSEADVSYRDRGYLVCATDKGLPVLEENLALQKSMGADTVILQGEDMRKRFPFITFDGITAVSFGAKNEGWFDPYALLTLMRKGAIGKGVDYIATEVTGLDLGGAQAVLTTASGETFKAHHVVNAAGTSAGAIAALAGIDLPVSPAKRYGYVVDCPGATDDLRAGPAVFDITGEYFRPEGRTFLCGFTPDEADEPTVKDWEMDECWFYDRVWPALAARVPAFETLKMVSSWVGHYDYNWFDQNGIIGRHPTLSNFYFGNGFSGHGIQQGPATGNAISELIIHGDFRTIDLKRMGYERLQRKEPLFEKNIF
jgi:FAD-dependent oxidoreductase domain-containing protein 1